MTLAYNLGISVRILLFCLYSCMADIYQAESACVAQDPYILDRIRLKRNDKKENDDIWQRIWKLISLIRLKSGQYIYFFNELLLFGQNKLKLSGEPCFWRSWDASK